MKIAILNGHLIDPANQVDSVTSLFIDAGHIVAVGGSTPPGFQPDQVFDATGKLIIPGLIDLSARLGEPGFEYRADINSESNSWIFDESELQKFADYIHAFTVLETFNRYSEKRYRKSVN